ncbi:hypothetical protein ABN028_05820 [Actinopolymorpha sp. B17G11]
MDSLGSYEAKNHASRVIAALRAARSGVRLDGLSLEDIIADGRI